MCLVWNYIMLKVESEKENCLMRIKSRGRSNKNDYKWYEQMQQDTFIREDSIALRGVLY